MTQAEFVTIKLLSGLLEIALPDLRELEKDPRYKVDMSTWHSPDSDDHLCHTCLAGSVLARELGVSPKHVCNPTYFGYDVRHRLWALEALRRGRVERAASFMWIPFGTASDLDRPMSEYGTPNFYPDMEKLLADLKEAGL